MGKVCSYLNYNLYPFYFYAMDEIVGAMSEVKFLGIRKLRLNYLLKTNIIQTSTLILNKIIYYNNCQLNLAYKKGDKSCLIF